MNKKLDIKNARFRLVDSTLKGYKEVEVVFNYNGEDYKYFIFIDEGKNTNYINEAKKQFNQDVKSGEVLKSIKPSAINHRSWLIACASALGVAAITFASLFTWKALTATGGGGDVPPGPVPPEPEPSNYVTLTLDAGEGNTIEGTKNQKFKYYVEKGTTVADTFKTLNYKGGTKANEDFLYWTINNQPINEDYIINEDINLVPVYKPVQKDCLTITARQDKLSINFTTGKSLQVSFDRENWNAVTSDAIVLEHAGDQVYIKREEETALSSKIISSSNKLHSVSGPIETLVGGKISEFDDRAFASCFSADSNLVAANNLNLGNITLANYCYLNMFGNCTSLTEAPALPVKELAPFCYQNMFFNCSSLIQAPILSATKLATSCCLNMFKNCSSLIAAPELPVEDLAESCYDTMFQNCLSLTIVPALPAKKLADNCYQNMFSGCASLTQAPTLSATELATGCCQSMFFSCSSLTKVPTLSATTLTNKCYNAMFANCTSLKIREEEGTTEGDNKIFTCPSDAPNNAISTMFFATTGDFTSATPTPGNTYYWYV